MTFRTCLREMSHKLGYILEELPEISIICAILLVPSNDQRESKDACGMVHFNHDKCEVIGECGIPTDPTQPGSSIHQEHQIH